MPKMKTHKGASKRIGFTGGRIGLHSSPGAGSTFWCELPLDLAEPCDV